MLGPVGLRHSFEEESLCWVKGAFRRFVRRIEGRSSAPFATKHRCSRRGLDTSPRSRSPVPRLRGLTGSLRLYTRGVRKAWERGWSAQPPGSRPRVPARRSLDMTTSAALVRWMDRGARPALRARVESCFGVRRQARMLRPFALVQRPEEWAPSQAPTCSTMSLRPSRPACWSCDGQSSARDAGRKFIAYRVSVRLSSRCDVRHVARSMPSTSHGM